MRCQILCLQRLAGAKTRHQPCLTLVHHRTIYSDILSDILSDVYSDIFSDIYSDIPSSLGRDEGPRGRIRQAVFTNFRRADELNLAPDREIGNITFSGTFCDIEMCHQVFCLDSLS